MKISLASNQWFDNQGYPLVAGRVSVFLHESDNPATIYTLEGDQFVEAQNPFILDEGGRCPTGSIWFDATVVDVKVEAYNGVPGSYTQVDRYEDGFEVPGVTNDSVIIGIDGLAAANTELGVVTVVGYDNAHDCEARQFVWDPNCTVNEDGGAIVASTTSENGRWILLSDSRYMPSSYYGIKAGASESNISAFLTYPETVGQWSIKLPPVPRFKKGTYTSAGMMTSPKTLSFDTGAKFTNMSFTCYAAEVMFSNDYVADFIFTEQQRAESSWFRTAKGFWICQARELHQSSTNHFANNNVGNYGTTFAIVQNQKVTGKPMTITGSANIEFNHCEFGDYSLSTNWCTVFKNCDFSDRWFNDGNWDFGLTVIHRQVVKNSENRVDVNNFADANVFVLQQASNNAVALDLQGRLVSVIADYMPFTYIKNATIDYAHFANDISLENCAISHLYLESASLTATTKNCTATVEQADALAWNDIRSTLALGCDIDISVTAVNWNGTMGDLISHRIGSATDDLSQQLQPVFNRCSLGNGTVASSDPVVLDSSFNNVTFYVYPHTFTENGQTSWTMSMEFRGNRFVGSSCIMIGAHNGLSDHLGEVFECQVTDLAISDNVFNTSSMGVMCPFWAGAGLAFRFIRGMSNYDGTDPNVHNDNYFPVRFEYSGNRGTCPRSYGAPTNEDNVGARAIAPAWAQNGGVDTGMIFEGDQTAYSVFVLPARPNANKDALPDPTVIGSVYSVSKLAVCTPYMAKATFTEGVNGGNCADFPVTGYMPVCAYDKSTPNDMFSCIVGSWGNSAQLFGINPLPSAQ